MEKRELRELVGCNYGKVEDSRKYKKAEKQEEGKEFP